MYQKITNTCFIICVGRKQLSGFRNDNKLRNFGFFLKTDCLAIESISKIPSFPGMNVWKEVTNESFKIVIWNN